MEPVRAGSGVSVRQPEGFSVNAREAFHTYNLYWRPIFARAG